MRKVTISLSLAQPEVPQDTMCKRNIARTEKRSGVEGPGSQRSWGSVGLRWEGGSEETSESGQVSRGFRVEDITGLYRGRGCPGSRAKARAELCVAFLHSDKIPQRTCHWPQTPQGVSGGYGAAPGAWTPLLGLWGLEGEDASLPDPLGCSLSPRVTPGHWTWCRMVTVTPCTAVPP